MSLCRGKCISVDTHCREQDEKETPVVAFERTLTRVAVAIHVERLFGRSFESVNRPNDCGFVHEGPCFLVLVDEER